MVLTASRIAWSRGERRERPAMAAWRWARVGARGAEGERAEDQRAARAGGRGRREDGALDGGARRREGARRGLGAESAGRGARRGRGGAADRVGEIEHRREAGLGRLREGALDR